MLIKRFVYKYDVIYVHGDVGLYIEKAIGYLFMLDL